MQSCRALVSHHDRENDGRHGGLEDPEQRQAQDLDEGEEVDLPEGDVPQVHQVGLVLGRHQQQLETIHELQESEAARETQGSVCLAHQHNNTHNTGMLLLFCFLSGKSEGDCVSAFTTITTLLLHQD